MNIFFLIRQERSRKATLQRLACLGVVWHRAVWQPELND
jgi:hypothetical protein